MRSLTTTNAPPSCPFTVEPFKPSSSPQASERLLELEPSGESPQGYVRTGQQSRWGRDDGFDRVQRRHSGHSHADGGEVVGVGQVDAGFGEDHVLVVDARVALYLSDVAALDVPARIGVRRHLPLQMRLDSWHAVDHALVLDVVASERALRHRVPTQVDVLGTRAEFVGE